MPANNISIMESTGFLIFIITLFLLLLSIGIFYIIKMKVREEKKTEELEPYQFESKEVKEALINHLSKEIEAHTHVVHAWRNKVNFTIFIGPYLVLGSFLLASKDSFNLLRNIDIPFAGILSIITCYLVLGFFSAGIEWEAFCQCNRWRDEISKLSGQKIDFKNFRYDLVAYNMFFTYLFTYLFMAFSFIVSLLVLGHVFSQTPLQPSVLPH